MVHYKGKICILFCRCNNCFLANAFFVYDTYNITLIFVCDGRILLMCLMTQPFTDFYFPKLFFSSFVLNCILSVMTQYIDEF